MLHPTTFQSEEGTMLLALFCCGSVSSYAVPANERRKACVLGMGCGCPTSGSELNLRPFGVSAGTSRAPRVFDVP